MLKTLYEHFAVLYHEILPKNPTIASEHALKQEEEIYSKSSKLTYRNETQAIIQCAGALKRRPLPDSLSHTSVGTEGDLSARAEARKSIQALRLTRNHLESFVMSKEDMLRWGYFVDIPEGPGGIEPSLEGKVAKCERCAQPFLVKRKEVADNCIHHWGKPFTTKVNGGMRVARVSVVDGSGAQVFDEFVRMDPGVEVIDYITRFSGITAENLSKAVLPLTSIRRSLDKLIDANTVLIGHALDNDLKTLRIIHHKCVDTVVLFPHRMGPPFRRSLKDLVRENLNSLIQTDSTVGHSSVEDAAATLDLVRWHILNKPPPKPKPAPTLT
ncbi:hypothetical protein H0H81_004934 [Sphagnurus paluster]|uniref:Exonuclease domain-containing protein n=1 Tax=Sphagnurus paluster TaxID=117069 RepID=A0A9P7FZK0_9AGAR|nr:hypothetical protein H0H81_004934 [Sphagnurus paluster]